MARRTTEAYRCVRRAEEDAASGGAGRCNRPSYSPADPKKGQDPGDFGGRRVAGEPVIAALSLSDPGPPEIKSPKQPSEQTPHGSASLRPYPEVLTPSRTERLSGSGHRLGEPSRPPKPRGRMGSACGPKTLHAAPRSEDPLAWLPAREPSTKPSPLGLRPSDQAPSVRCSAPVPFSDLAIRTGFPGPSSVRSSARSASISRSTVVLPFGCPGGVAYRQLLGTFVNIRMPETHVNR
jgi:hypothetical protein